MADFELKQSMQTTVASRSAAEIKRQLLNQRDGFIEIERRQFAEAMALTPSERLLETLELCDSAAEFTREEVTIEDYVADSKRRRRLAEAWKAKRRA